MARIVGYIGASIDGYIAAPDGSLAWLTKYDGMDLGAHSYENFIQRIRTVVMGRETYEFFEREDVPWPYAGLRAIVVTSRPIPAPRGPVETWSRGVDALIAELRSLADGDVWMLGGGRLQMAFLERGALDEIEIFVVPEMIGGGAPLFPATGFGASPELVSATAIPPGCVRLHYRFTGA